MALTGRLPPAFLSLRRILAMRMFILAVFCFLLGSAVSRAQLPDDQPQGPALRPEEALEHFMVADGLRWELLLAEPTISQPLATRFDAAGRLWVVQYLQYPEPAGLKVLSRDNFWRIVYDRVPKPPGEDVAGADKISIFSDGHGDGTYKFQADFVEGLNIATSVVPVHQGAWVLNPPYLLYYHDRDGDGRADGSPEVHLEGFGLEDTHSVANSLCLGPDGWLYGAQGSTVSGNLRRFGTAEQPHRTLGQLIWRYHPTLRRYEVFAEGGGNAFGVAFDDRGHIFSGHNGGDTRGFHYIQGGYFRKGFSKHGDLSNPFAYGYIEQMAHEPVQRFSHALLALEGTQLQQRCPSAFLAVDPLHSKLFHSHRTATRSTYRTHDVESLVTSQDKWFRPVAVSDGPDGAAYVCDWYDSQVAHIYAHEGKYDRDHGRVYRLSLSQSAETSEPWNGQWADAIDEVSLFQLVQRLRSPIRWQRWQARELIARHPRKFAARETLIAMASEDTPSALDAYWTMHQAGWVADGIGSESNATILPEHYFEHPVPGIREWSVRLACDDGQLRRESLQKLQHQILTEVDPMVLVQLACSARRLPAQDAMPCFRRFLERELDMEDLPLINAIWWLWEHHADAWQEMEPLIRDVSCFRSRLYRERLVPNVVQRWCSQGTQASYAAAECVLQTIALLPLEERSLAASLALRGFEKAFEGRSFVGVPDSLLDAVVQLGEPSLPLRLRRGDAAARDAAVDQLFKRQGTAEERVQLATLFRELPYGEAAPALVQAAIDDQEVEQVRLAAASALRSYDDPHWDQQLLEVWSNLTPSVRSVVAIVWAGKARRAHRLLDALESERISSSEIPIEAVRLLRQIDDPSVQSRADVFFPSVPGLSLAQATQMASDLAKIIMSGSGNPYVGKKLYAQHCGRCHRLFDRGENLGPDLTGYQRDQLASLLLNVVAPSLEVREGYQAFAVLTVDDSLLVGFLQSQDERQVVIRGSDGQTHVLQRTSIAELRPQPQSLMPDGLLDNLSDQELRDLFAYLRSSQPLADGT